MYKFSLFLVLFYAVVFGWSATIDYKCTPNETYQEECNTCICSSDGKSAACTLAGCLNLSTDLPIVSTSSIQLSSAGTTDISHQENQTSTTEGNMVLENNNHVCTPNDVKMQDCNRCRCAANGIGWFCTRRLCPQNGSNGHQKRAVHSPRANCKPNDKWNDGCNDCFCTPNGLVACTDMLCLDDTSTKMLTKRSVTVEKPSCTPGAKWKKDCNDCFCTDTGIGACTLRGCVQNEFHLTSRIGLRTVTLKEFEDSNFSCQPLKNFKLECKTCKCSSDGKGAIWCNEESCDPQKSG